VRYRRGRTGHEGDIERRLTENRVGRSTKSGLI
jgi:hypothetical protein